MLNETVRDNPPRKGFRPVFIVQYLLIALCVSLLTGCFYFPTLEHRADKHQSDFRDLVGDEESKRPIRPHGIGRDDVLKLLGEPQYLSQDNRAMGYVLTTERAAWIAPLCFAATPAAERTYVLRLIFDDHDALTSCKMVYWDYAISWLSGVYIPAPESKLIEQLNADGPALVRRGVGPASQPTVQNP